ncbi:MAG: hypothetical protein ACE5KV_09220 [Thermoplasmata archaeon]
MWLETVLVALVAALSFALFITSIISYRRSRDSKIAVVSVAFFLILVKSVIWIAGLFNPEIDVPTIFILLAVMDVAVLLTFFVATLKPS